MSIFTFYFPEKYNLNPITISSSSDIVTCPALPRMMNYDNFIGWKIKKITGASIISNISQLLTKNQILIFTDRTKIVNIELQEQFLPILSFYLEWGQFGNKSINNKLLSSDGYVLTDVNGIYLTFKEE